MNYRLLFPAASLFISVGLLSPYAAALAQMDNATPNASPAETIQPDDEQPDNEQPDNEQPDATQPDNSINLSPETIEQSPVLQRWLNGVPNVREDIRNDPSFKTRLQLGYSYFPSSDGTDGFAVGVEDVFIGRTPLTVSADYQQNFEGDRTSYGANLHYYALPLGSYFNVSPILGYRHADSAEEYSVDGANVGVRLRLVPSRTGAADITLDQSWIVGDSKGLSVTHVNVGYALTQELRLSTDLEWQSTADEGDSRVGVNLEWMF